MTVQVIFLIRHAEKPISGQAAKFLRHPAKFLRHPHKLLIGIRRNYHGINIFGKRNRHSLTPRGWQRAGALATLFDAAVETMRPDLAVPSQLYSPRYRCASHHHRAYQTLLPLSLRLKLTINNTCFPTDEGAELARCVVDNDDGVSLVCWDHKNIPDIADAIPRASDSVIPPPTWPDDVFDIIWAFTQSSTEPGKYNFTRLNQCLLQGDTA